MEQAKKEMLAAAGIDAEDALERFMGSEALLTRFLGRFLEDASMDALRGAVAAGDWLPHPQGDVRQPVHDGAV